MQTHGKLCQRIDCILTKIKSKNDCFCKSLRYMIHKDYHYYFFFASTLHCNCNCNCNKDGDGENRNSHQIIERWFLLVHYNSNIKYKNCTIFFENSWQLDFVQGTVGSNLINEKWLKCKSLSISHIKITQVLENTLQSHVLSWGIIFVIHL